jgi:NitT/TauT family transport system permease protein
MRFRVWFDRLIVLLILLAAWQGASAVLGEYWLSTPAALAARFIASLGNGELLFHGGYTISEAVIGCVIGGVPAVLLPFALRNAPKLAFAPLFILWFGIGIESKIALIAAVVFFIVYFSTLSGVRALDLKLVQMAQVMGASERQVGRHIVFPGAVPSIFAGFRIAVPYAIGAAVIAELISSNRGLGYLVQTGAMNFDTTQVFVAILAATLIVHAFIAVVDLTERFLLRWRPRGAALIVDHGT